MSMKLWFLILNFIALTILTNPLQAAEHQDNTPTEMRFIDQLPDSGNLILGVFEQGELGRFGNTIDQMTNGGIRYAIKAVKFDGKQKSTALITAPQGSGYDQILLLGLGKKEQVYRAIDWQTLAGHSVQAARKHLGHIPPLVLDTEIATTVNIALGAKLGSYYFDKYYTDNNRVKHQSHIDLVVAQASSARQLYLGQQDPVANGVWFTRDSSNEPANVIYPESFVSYWKKHLKTLDNIKIKTFDEKDMLKQGMGAIYGVGQGSKRPPRMMVVEYRGGKKGEAPIVLVGKGITFDTGGISIKGANKMWNMKFDMSGAASVMGALYAVAGREAKVNVVAIAALAENMPSSHAQRPGDVVTSLSGKTIQIRSTDAEGRLVLADALYYADTNYNPTLLVNVATLTGAASRALGKDYAALFSRHQQTLASKFIEIGQQTGEDVWPMPLNDNHFKAIQNNVADVMNSGPSAPGASAAAAFLATFVRESTQWVHLDIAGVGWNDEPTPLKASPGSTSFGVKLLNGYIKAHYEQE